MVEFALVILNGQTFLFPGTVGALAPLLLMDVDGPAVGASEGLRRFVPIR